MSKVKEINLDKMGPFLAVVGPLVTIMYLPHILIAAISFKIVWGILLTGMLGPPWSVIQIMSARLAYGLFTRPVGKKSDLDKPRYTWLESLGIVAGTSVASVAVAYIYRYVGTYF